MRIFLTLTLFFSSFLIGGCATTREHTCDDCTLGIETIKEGHIPRLSADDCTWGMARFLEEDINFFVSVGGATWQQLGVTPEWVAARVEAARLNDIIRAKHELEVLRSGSIDPDRAFKIRLPVVSGLCVWSDLGVTAEEQKLIEELLAPPDQVAGN